MPNLNLLTLLSRRRAMSETPSSSSKTATEDSNTRQEQNPRAPRASQSDHALPRSSLSVSSPSPPTSPLERRIHPNLNALAEELSISSPTSHPNPVENQSHEISDKNHNITRTPSSDSTIPFVSLTPWLRSRRHSTGGPADMNAPSSPPPTTGPTTIDMTNTNTNANVETETNNSNSNDNLQSENPLPQSLSSTTSTSDPAGLEAAADTSHDHDVQNHSFSSSANSAPSNNPPESSRANRILTRLTNIRLRSTPTSQSQQTPPSAWNTFGRRKTRRVNSVPHMSDFGTSAGSSGSGAGQFSYASSQRSQESSQNTTPLHRHEGDVSGYTSGSESNSYSYSQSRAGSIPDSYSVPYSIANSPQSPQSSQPNSQPQSRSPSYVAMTPSPSHRQQLPSVSGFTFGSMGSGQRSGDLASPTRPPPTSILRLSLFGGRRQASASTAAEEQEDEKSQNVSVSEQGVEAEVQERAFQFNIDSLVLPHPRTSTSMPSMSDYRTLSLISDYDNHIQDNVITSGAGSSSSRPRAQDIFNTLGGSSSSSQLGTGSRRTRTVTTRSSGGSSVKRRTRRGSRPVPARPALAGAFDIGGIGEKSGEPAGSSTSGNMTRADNVQAAASSPERLFSASLSEQGPSLALRSIDPQTTRILSGGSGSSPILTENPAALSQESDINEDSEHQQTHFSEQDNMVTEISSIGANAKGKGRERASESPSLSSRKSSIRTTPSVSSPLAGSMTIPLPSVSPPSTPRRNMMNPGMPIPIPSPVARSTSNGKRKADEAEVDSVIGLGLGLGLGLGAGGTLEVKKQHKATFAEDPRPHRFSTTSQTSNRSPHYTRKRARISSSGSTPSSVGGQSVSTSRPSSRGTGQPSRARSVSHSSHRVPSGSQPSRSPSASSHQQPHYQRHSLLSQQQQQQQQQQQHGSISHPSQLQSRSQVFPNRSRERVESISKYSQVSIPISAFVTPHAPSIARSQHPSTVTGRGAGYHMRDPRKPPRVQDTSWSLSLPERGFFAARWGDCITLSGAVERLSGMLTRKKMKSREMDVVGVGEKRVHGDERDPVHAERDTDRRDIDDEQATRRSSVRWTESGGSPLHAWLFFLGFVVFPVWWVAGFLVAVPRTRRLGSGSGGDEEKGVLLDDPQLEHDAKSWRTRCRIMAAVSLITYVPFIVLIAVFVPRTRG